MMYILMRANKQRTIKPYKDPNSHPLRVIVLGIVLFLSIISLVLFGHSTPASASGNLKVLSRIDADGAEGGYNTSTGNIAFCTQPNVGTPVGHTYTNWEYTGSSLTPGDPHAFAWLVAHLNTYTLSSVESKQIAIWGVCFEKQIEFEWDYCWSDGALGRMTIYNDAAKTKIHKQVRIFGEEGSLYRDQYTFPPLSDKSEILRAISEALSHKGEVGWWDKASRVWYNDDAAQNVVEVFPQGCIHIRKQAKSGTNVPTDNPNYSLGGAKFRLYTSQERASAGTINETQTKVEGATALDASQGECELSTDPRGWADSPEILCGTYYLREIESSPGFVLDTTIHEIAIEADKTLIDGREVHSAAINGVVDAHTAIIYEPDLGALSLHKESSLPSISENNSCYSLEGAIYTIYTNKDSAQAKSNHDIAGTITTNQSGDGSINNLTVGTYYVTETHPAPGFALDKTVYVAEVKPNETTRVNGPNSESAGTVYDQPTTNPIELIVQKVDAETNSPTALGTATLEGAEFTVYYFDSTSYASAADLPKDANGSYKETAKRWWTFKTTAEGKAYLSNEYLVDSNGPLYTTSAEEGSFCLPLGTIYVEESKAPEGYLLSSKPLSNNFQVITGNGSQLVTAYVEPTPENPSAADPVKRGDFFFNKKGTNQEALANCVFSITSDTTGESHIIVTDENGFYSSEASYNPHTQETNQNDKALMSDGSINEEALSKTSGLWFEGTTGVDSQPDDTRGALAFDTYTVQELACEANRDYTLVSFSVTVSRDGYVINRGTITDTSYEMISEALDSESKTHYATGAEQTKFTDTVELKGLQVGSEYRLEASLYDTTTATELEGIQDSRTFVAEHSQEKQQTSLSFDSSQLAGHTLVVFERLYCADQIMIEECNPDNDNQSVSILGGTLKTHATDAADGDSIIAAGSDSAVINDTVAYESLVPDCSYVLTGTLMNKTAQEPLKDESGNEISAQTTFIPSESAGEIVLSFAFNPIGVAPSEVVVFEELTCEGTLVAQHKDFEDENQTVTLELAIDTCATDANDGDQEIEAAQDAIITDTVSLKGLVSGQSYRLVSTIVEKDSECALDLEQGVGITDFVATSGSEEVMVSLPIKADLISGSDLVILEELQLVKEVESDSAEESHYLTLLAHFDLEDEDQTITVHEPPLQKLVKTGQTNPWIYVLILFGISAISLVIALGKFGKPHFVGSSSLLFKTRHKKYYKRLGKQ